MVEGVKLVPVASIYLRNVVGAEGLTARDRVIIGAPLLVALIVLFLQLSAGYWLFLAPRSVRRAWEWMAGRIGESPPGPPSPP
jgi:hypothetical protein